ncbi:MAG: HDOD domain-containing protein [Candidatus Cloacimonetes bacterium]|nr:HDOD domain-containing protein [Candidatus Cloacimonadota bacterium]
MDQSEIKKLTSHIINLPALPSVAAKLFTLIDNSQTSAEQIAKLISSDQAITAKILRVANSSYYAFTKEIKSVRLAVALLGLDTVLNICLSVSLYRNMSSIDSNDAFDMMAFWEHSLSVAIIAKMLAEKFRINNPEDFFTIAILHDIGKLIIHEYFANEYQQIYKIITLKKCTSKEAEERVLKTNHAKIGGWLCQNWNFPERISYCVETHHNIEPAGDTSFKKAAAIIHLADFLANITGKNYPFVEHDISELDNQINSILPVKTKEIMDENILDIDYYSEISQQELKKADEFLSLLKNI